MRTEQKLSCAFDVWYDSLTKSQKESSSERFEMEKLAESLRDKILNVECRDVRSYFFDRLLVVLINDVGVSVTTNRIIIEAMIVNVDNYLRGQSNV
jgi:hypothetical protein